MSAIRSTKRKHDRIKDTILLDVFKAGAFKPACRACLTDISLGGAGFECTEKFESGDKINLVFLLADGKEYVLDTAVRRVSRSTGTYLYGVQFLSINFFKRFRLKRFISKLLESSE